VPRGADCTWPLAAFYHHQKVLRISNLKPYHAFFVIEKNNNPTFLDCLCQVALLARGHLPRIITTRKCIAHKWANSYPNITAFLVN
jgi:hypothetical protein